MPARLPPKPPGRHRAIPTGNGGTYSTKLQGYFVLCTGSNPKQIQAIADEIGLRLKDRGELPHSLEGYNQAEWILADYGDFLVHVFSEKSRSYYDLERLWRNAKNVPIPPE